jgi:hypothetical protein
MPVRRSSCRWFFTSSYIDGPPHALICELQPVTIQNTQTADDKEFSQPLLEQVKFDISNLTHEEYEIGKKLINCACRHVGDIHSDFLTLLVSVLYQ